MSWMYSFWVIHYFVEGVKMTSFTWDSELDYRGVKRASERWQHRYVILTQRLVGLLLKLADFSNLCALYTNGDQSKWEKAASFFLQVCIPVN